jgi:hypothetical protein
MSQAVEPTPSGTSAETDLVSALQQVLQSSDEPQTLSKIRARLPVRHREVSLEELAGALTRQVAAQVVYQFPKYRSQQDRYWDRPMNVHVAALLRTTLAETPLGWSDLRRKLPAYAVAPAEEAVQELLKKGELFKHPRVGRSSERFGVRPPDPRDYLRSELSEVFTQLETLGFTKEQLRASALELLHDEEWASPPAPQPNPDQASNPVS